MNIKLTTISTYSKIPASETDIVENIFIICYGPEQLYTCTEINLHKLLSFNFIKYPLNIHTSCINTA